MGVLTCIVPFLFFFLLGKIKNLTFFLFIILTFCFSIVYCFILWYFSGIYKDFYGLIKLSFILFYKYTATLTIISIIFMIIVNEKKITYRKTKNVRNKEKKLIITSEKKKELEPKIIIYSDNKK